MDFIQEVHATAYLSSTLDFHYSGFMQNTCWFVTNILVPPSRAKMSKKKGFSSWIYWSLGHHVLKCQWQNNLCHVTTQKPEDLMYTMAEAWNLVLTSTFCLKITDWWWWRIGFVLHMTWYMKIYKFSKLVKMHFMLWECQGIWPPS